MVEAKINKDALN